MTRPWISLLLTVCLLLPFSQPALGLPPAAPPQAPSLGPWIDIWAGMDVYRNLSPAVAYNSRHDEYLVVWVDEVDSYTWRIWARRVGGRGQLLSNFVVATFAGKRCTEPRVAYSPGQDRYLVVYNYRYSDSDHDIYGQLIPGDGSAPLLSPIHIIDDGNDQDEPAIAYNSWVDEFLVAYSELAAGEYNIYLERRAAGDGTLIAPRWAVPGGGAGMSRYSPALAYNPRRNQYLVAYNATPAGWQDVRSILVSAGLSPLGSEMHLWDHVADRYADEPTVAAGRDDYLVAWAVRDLTPPAPSIDRYDSHARRVSAAGMPQGPAFALTVASYPFDCRHPTAVAYADGYGYLAGLHYAQGIGEQSDTYACFVLPAAQAPAGEFAIDDTTYRAVTPSIACSTGRTCLVAESYQVAAGAKSDIRGRLIYVQRAYLPVTLR